MWIAFVKWWIQIHKTDVFAWNYLDPDDSKQTKQKVSMEFVLKKCELFQKGIQMKKHKSLTGDSHTPKKRENKMEV